MLQVGPLLALIKRFDMKITWVLTHRKVRGKVVPKYYIKEYYENKTVREKKRDETILTKQI